MGSSNFTHVAAVTPADATPFTSPTYAEWLWVGGAGNVKLITRGGETVTFSGVPAGTFLPIECTGVESTGTTATLILRCWRL